LAKYEDTPDKYVWHHYESIGILQLVEERWHNAFTHSGGVSRKKGN